MIFPRYLTKRKLIYKLKNKRKAYFQPNEEAKHFKIK